jgi:hypothetical protein
VVRGGGAFYPSPPTPLPWKGRGELDADCGRKADAFTPLPFEGRGDGGEGSKNPGIALSTLPGQCGSSVVVEYPWCVWEGRFTPHPRPLSPGRGEGSWLRVQGEKQTLPLSPLRERGMGVRGQRTLPAPRQRLRGSADPASLWSIRGAAGGAFYPSPSPLSPGRGEGSWMRIAGEKQTPPLSPLRGEGDGGEGSKNPCIALSTPPGQCGSSVVVEYPWCVWEGRFTPHPHPLPFQGRGELDAGSGRKADSLPSPL